MFLQFFGRDRDPATLSQRDWDRFIGARRVGRIGISGKPVSNRTIEWDLTFLMAVLNWAARSKDEGGRPMLDRNPLKGLRKPREKNPSRVVLTEQEYQGLLRVSREVDWRFHVALVLAHETGHRIGAIRKLRWSDIDFEGEAVRWRAKHEKTGYEHTTPVTDEALDALEEARAMSAGTGDGPVLPAPTDASRCVGRSLPSFWWQRAQTLAALETEAGPRLALAEAEIRVRPHGPAPQGAVRTRRLEDGQDRPPVLSESRRGTAETGARGPPESSGLIPISGNQSAGIAPAESVSSMITTRSARECACSPSAQAGSGCCRFARSRGCARARRRVPARSTFASAPSPRAAART